MYKPKILENADVYSLEFEKYLMFIEMENKVFIDCERLADIDFTIHNIKEVSMKRKDNKND